MSNEYFEPIVIRKHESGGWEVLQGDLTTEQLCFGEMLEMVVKLSNPGTPGHMYTMKTQEEWDAQ